MELTRRTFLKAAGGSVLLASTGLLTGCSDPTPPSNVTATSVTLGDFKITLENTALVHYTHQEDRILNEYQKALVGLSIRRLRDNSPINDDFNVNVPSWSGGLEASKNGYELLSGGKMEYKDYGYRQRLADTVAQKLLNLPEAPAFLDVFEQASLSRVNTYRGSLRTKMIQEAKNTYYFWSEINCSVDGVAFKAPSVYVDVEDIALQKKIRLQMPFDAAREMTTAELGL